MITYCYGVWNEFLNFIGRKAGLAHWIFFFAALLLCFFMGKEVRKKFFYPSLLAILFFFNPLFYAVVGTRFLSGIYWRLMWMVPISFVLAYVLAELIGRLKKNIVRAVAVVLACACIAVTGKQMFTAETYTEKENEYELPDAVIEICDYIQINLMSWKETAVVPNDLLCYIRQYSSSVGLFYGRNAGGFISNIGEDETAVYEEMSKEKPDIKVITDIGKKRYCKYLIFDNTFHQIPEDLTEYGYEKVYVVEDRYVIYRIFEEERVWGSDGPGTE